MDLQTLNVEQWLKEISYMYVNKERYLYRNNRTHYNPLSLHLFSLLIFYIFWKIKFHVIFYTRIVSTALFFTDDVYTSIYLSLYNFMYDSVS